LEIYEEADNLLPNKDPLRIKTLITKLPSFDWKNSNLGSQRRKVSKKQNDKRRGCYFQG